MRVGRTENRKSAMRMCRGPAQDPGPEERWSGVLVGLVAATYLLVSLQLLEEGALVEQPLQPVLGIVVAQFLEGGSTGRAAPFRVLEAWCVHDHHGTE